jgi:urocanate hydratase
MLWQLQDYQEDKDHPQAQVVNVEVDELYVESRILGVYKLICATDFDNALSLSSTSTNFENSISTHS